MINTVSISDLKQNTASVIKRVKNSDGPIVVLQRSKPVAVLVNFSIYLKMEKALKESQSLKHSN